MRRALAMAGLLLLAAGIALGLRVAWDLVGTNVVAEQRTAETLGELEWARDPAPAPAPSVEPTTQEPPYSTAFATLRVPAWGEDYIQPITQGTDPAILDGRGLGHYEGTAMPGTDGNFAVAGHRVTHGKPLNRINELVVGDLLVVQTEEGTYTYRVTETLVVSPTAVDVIEPTPGRATMTLTTCHPEFSARERFIVHAELDTRPN